MGSAALLFSWAAQAQPTVVDLNPEPPEDNAPRGILHTSAALPLHGDHLYFAVETETDGRELWQVSLAGDGGRLVADLSPGPLHGVQPTVVSLRDRVFFLASSPVSTDRVFELDPATGEFGPTALFPKLRNAHVNTQWLDVRPGWLTLIATSADDGRISVFQTDGTRPLEGPTAVLPSSFSDIDDVLPLKDGLLLHGDRGYGSRLVSVTSNGVEELLTEVSEGGVKLVGSHGGRAFYSWTHSSTYGGLWVTDGTAVGTRRLHELPAAKGMSGPGGFWFFTPNDVLMNDFTLWRITDGTEEPVRIADGLENPSGLGTVRNRFLFTNGSSVWAADATTGAVEVLAHAGWGPLIRHDGHGYFAGRDDQVGSDYTLTGKPVLMKTDGTRKGTRSHAAFDSKGEQLAVVPSASTPSGLLLTEAGGRDGALYLFTPPSGTRQIFVAPREPAGSEAQRFTKLGNGLLLWADNGRHGFEPWFSDGTRAGTSLLWNLEPGHFRGLPERVKVEDSWAVFTVKSRQFETDGTGAGTGEVPWDPARLGEDLHGSRWFTKRHPGANWALDTYSVWRKDGEAEAALILDGLEEVGRLLPVGEDGVVIYGGKDHQRSLWWSDGGPAATLMEMPGGISDFAELDGVILFTVIGGADDGLWRTDGTPAGTYRLGAGWLDPVRVGDVAFYAGSDGESGFEPWVTDGTLKGTRRVADVVPGPGSSSPRGFAQSAGGIVFWASTGTSFALWVTDGTEAGTRQLSDVRVLYDVLLTAYRSGLPVFVPLSEGRLAFSGWSVRGGLEPWVTDGTVEGTGEAFDVRPGPSSSSPIEFVRAGDSVFFSAADAEVGRELHMARDEEFLPRVRLEPGTQHWPANLATQSEPQEEQDTAQLEGDEPVARQEVEAAPQGCAAAPGPSALALVAMAVGAMAAMRRRGRSSRGSGDSLP